MDKSVVIKKIFKILLPIFLILILFLLSVFFLIGGLTGLKEMLPVFIYIIPILFFILLIGGFIGYKSINNKYLDNNTLLTIQSPLIMLFLSMMGISLEKSNPQKFSFYYNLFFGISLILFGLILYFASSNYRNALIPFIFGIVTIIWAVIKREKTE